MPWLETSPVLERQRFVKDVDSGHWTMSEHRAVLKRDKAVGGESRVA